MKFNTKIPTLLTTACAFVMIGGDTAAFSETEIFLPDEALQISQDTELHKFCCSCAACTN